jgi:signal transduction histidine kinase
LYISKNIVEAHGGKIEAHNNPNSKGATFIVTLPLNLD